jgi:Zn-dependent peptidase ImmA (M78 family)
MEQEANAFAVALLMPTTDIRPYLVSRHIDLAMLAALKPEWRVSMAALLMRAHKLKCLTDNQYQYLWKQMSARGYRLREPPELDFDHERAEVLEQIIQVHLGSLAYSPEDLAKVLCVHERELRQLYVLGDDERPRRSRLTIVR